MKEIIKVLLITTILFSSVVTAWTLCLQIEIHHIWLIWVIYFISSLAQLFVLYITGDKKPQSK